MATKRMTEVTPMIIPREVKRVRILFLKMDWRLERSKSVADGLSFSIFIIL